MRRRVEVPAGLPLNNFHQAIQPLFNRDNWHHTITLEKMLPSAGQGTQPRRIAGRGFAPLEDTAGLWGWMDKVHAVNNPDIAELRQWFGVQSGEALDPSEFSHADVNEALKPLKS